MVAHLGVLTSYGFAKSYFTPIQMNEQNFDHPCLQNRLIDSGFLLPLLNGHSRQVKAIARSEFKNLDSLNSQNIPLAVSVVNK